MKDDNKRFEAPYMTLAEIKRRWPKSTVNSRSNATTQWFSRTGSGSATTGREAGIMDNTDKQTIISTASPRPWRVETNRFGQHYVVCESGSGDQVRDYIAGPIQNESDAALIVEAVNERDRLRDIVRRLADRLELERDLEPYDADADALLQEARAAIGEGKP